MDQGAPHARDVPDERIVRILINAVELRGDVRSSYLDQTCGGDAALRSEVERLLANEDSARAAIPTPIVGASDNEWSHPQRIGPYRIIEQIGQGGMGRVYLAEQESPLRRRVALKLIRPGMDSDEVVARFTAERQALAMLNHPNIARVYDAGTVAETGRPYFVMEHVEAAQPITAFAHSHRLTLSQKLDLFMLVCHAVQHAHWRGILHRDIKPSNILVAIQDGKPQPKVIDFGVAKAIVGDSLAEQSNVTQVGNRVGTPAYMSPEQIQSSRDVDARSDVFSLGVVLGELLSGDERARRGEISAIVHKATTEDPSRRYTSAAALAEDLERYLRGEPIMARGDHIAYVLRKLLRRYRLAVAVATAFVLLLGVGLATTLLLWRQAAAARQEETHQRQRADREAAEARKHAAVAEQRARETQQVADFQAEQLGDIDVAGMGSRLRTDLLEEFAAALKLAGVDPTEVAQRSAALDKSISGANLTNVALKQIDREIFARALTAADKFNDQPVVKAQLLETMAVTLRELGLLDRAAEPQTQALELRRRALGDEHIDTLRSMNNLGLLMQLQGRPEQADRWYVQALAIGTRALGAEHQVTLTSLNNLASVQANQGRLKEAEASFRQLVETRSRVLGSEHPDTLVAMANLGGTLRSQGKLDEAESWYRRVLDIRRQNLGDDHPDTLNAMHNMGFILNARGERVEAEGFYRGALAGRRRCLGDEHPDTLVSMSNLANLLHAQQQNKEAESLAREALMTRRRVLGAEHPDTLKSINILSGLLESLGRFDEALALAREALQTRRRVLGDEHRDTLTSFNLTGFLLQKQGQLAEAEECLSYALETRRRVLGNDHPETLHAIINMGGIRLAQRRLPEALALFTEAVETGRRTLGDEHPDVARFRNNLAGLLMQQGDYAVAAEHYRIALAVCRKKLPNSHTAIAVSRSGLGRARVKLGQCAEAEPLLLEAHAAAAKPGPAIKDLIELYDAWHAAAPRDGHDAQAARWRTTLQAWQATTRVASPHITP